MKLLRWLGIPLLAWLGAAGVAAHPLAQGAIDLDLLPEKIRVEMRVSSEEILVADTFLSRGGSSSRLLSDVWRNHGQYLLKHLKIFADERPLTGVVLAVEPAQGDGVMFRFEFSGAVRPARLRVEEDVLNEIEFTSGNPWEASYVVRIRQQGGLAREGVALSRKQPLVFDCDWKNAAPSPPDRSGMTTQFAEPGVRHILGRFQYLLFVGGALVVGAAAFWMRSKSSPRSRSR